MDLCVGIYKFYQNLSSDIPKQIWKYMNEIRLETVLLRCVNFYPTKKRDTMVITKVNSFKPNYVQQVLFLPYSYQIEY